MLLDFKRGQTGIILRAKVLNSSVSTGAGMTGLSSSSTGMIISTICDNEDVPTVYTVAGSTIEGITTLGTYAAPTATKCRFRKVDDTNHPGTVELQFANARFAVAGSKSMEVTISGVTNMAETDFVVPLRDVDPYDATRFGMTALPNAIPGAANGLVTFGTGTGQENPSGGKSPATVAAGDMAANSLNASALATDAVNEIVAAVWTITTSSLTGVGSIGKLFIDMLDVAVGSRLSTLGYTAPNNAGIGTLITGVSVSSIGNDVITPASIQNNAFIATKFAMSALTAIANEVENQIIDETDSEKVLLAITNKIAAANPDLSGLTLSAIASAVYAAFATERGLINTNLNATVNSRLATSGYTAPDNASITNILTKANLIPAAPASVTDIPTVAQIWAKLTTELTGAGSVGKLLVDMLNVAIGTRSLGTDQTLIKAVTDFLSAMLQSDGHGGKQYTVGALENAPTGSGGGSSGSTTLLIPPFFAFRQSYLTGSGPLKLAVGQVSLISISIRQADGQPVSDLAALGYDSFYITIEDAAHVLLQSIQLDVTDDVVSFINEAAVTSSQRTIAFTVWGIGGDGGEGGTTPITEGSFVVEYGTAPPIIP